MSRVKPAYELEELARIARARETARAQQRTANPKPYQKKGETTAVYYRSVLDEDQVIEIPVFQSTLTEIGNLDDFGITTTKPSGTSPIPVRGLQIPILRIRWYYGDNTPQVIVTQWKTRWIKFYDKKGDASHRSIPFCSAIGGADKLDDLISKFDRMFNETNGTKRSSLLGPNGKAELAFGKQVLARS